MAGCDGIFTASLIGGRALYGRSGKAIVRSRDKGLTWQTPATLPADVRDLGYDQAHDRIYAAAADNSFCQCDGPACAPVNITRRLPRDQHGDGFMTSTVAVDPVVPDIVYAGANGTGLLFQRSNGFARSKDGGRNLGTAASESLRLRRGRLRRRDGERPARPPRHPRSVRRRGLLRDLEDRPARGREGVGGGVTGAPRAPSVRVVRPLLPRGPAAPASARPSDLRRSASGSTDSAPGRPAS